MDAAHVESLTGELLIKTTKDVHEEFGQSAADQLLRGNLSTLVAIAYSRLGPADTKKLLRDGLKTVQTMAAGNVRP
jgi:hypothetical protein